MSQSGGMVTRLLQSRLPLSPLNHIFFFSTSALFSLNHIFFFSTSALFPPQSYLFPLQSYLFFSTSALFRLTSILFLAAEPPATFKITVIPSVGKKQKKRNIYDLLFWVIYIYIYIYLFYILYIYKTTIKEHFQPCLSICYFIVPLLLTFQSDLVIENPLPGRGLLDVVANL